MSQNKNINTKPNGVVGNQLAVSYMNETTISSDAVLLGNTPIPKTELRLPSGSTVVGSAMFNNSARIPHERQVNNKKFFTRTGRLRENGGKIEIDLGIPGLQTDSAAIVEQVYKTTDEAEDAVKKFVADLKLDASIKVDVDFKTSTTQDPDAKPSNYGFNVIRMNQAMTDYKFQEAYRGALRAAEMMRQSEANYMAINDYSLGMATSDVHIIVELKTKVAAKMLSKKKKKKGTRALVDGDIIIASFTVTTGTGDSATTHSTIVDGPVDIQALTILFLERAYGMINERAIRHTSQYFDLLHLVPTLQLKYPEYSEVLTTVLSRLTTSRHQKTASQQLAYATGYLGRNWNNANYREPLTRAHSLDAGVATPLYYNDVHETGLTYQVISAGADGELQEENIIIADADWNMISSLIAKMKSGDWDIRVKTIPAVYADIDQFIEGQCFKDGFKIISERWYRAVHELLTFIIPKGVPTAFSVVVPVYHPTQLSVSNLFLMLAAIVDKDGRWHNDLEETGNEYFVKNSDGTVTITTWRSIELMIPEMLTSDMSFFYMAGPIVDIQLFNTEDVNFVPTEDNTAFWMVQELLKMYGEIRMFTNSTKAETIVLRDPNKCYFMDTVTFGAPEMMLREYYAKEAIIPVA